MYHGARSCSLLDAIQAGKYSMWLCLVWQKVSEFSILSWLLRYLAMFLKGSRRNHLQAELFIGKELYLYNWLFLRGSCYRHSWTREVWIIIIFNSFQIVHIKKHYLHGKQSGNVLWHRNKVWKVCLFISLNDCCPSQISRCLYFLVSEQRGNFWKPSVQQTALLHGSLRKWE